MHENQYVLYNINILIFFNFYLTLKLKFFFLFFKVINKIKQIIFKHITNNIQFIVKTIM